MASDIFQIMRRNVHGVLQQGVELGVNLWRFRSLVVLETQGLILMINVDTVHIGLWPVLIELLDIVRNW